MYLLILQIRRRSWFIACVLEGNLNERGARRSLRRSLFSQLRKISSKCEKSTAEDDDLCFNTRPFPYPLFFFASHFRIDFYQKYIYLYICVYVCPTPAPLSISLLADGVDRPPNARVLRTDIRTIKEFLMVRIWSRWAAGVRRRNQSYRYFVPRLVVYDRTRSFRWQ